MSDINCLNGPKLKVTVLLRSYRTCLLEKILTHPPTISLIPSVMVSILLFVIVCIPMSI